MSEESTTPDLVELTRAWLQAGTSGDLERMLSFFGPDPVWDMSPMGMGVFEGRAAIRGFYKDWLGAYEGYRIEPEEIHDLGNGVTWSVVLQQGRPMGSGGTVQLRYGTCATWTDGKAVRVWNYHDIDEARAAAERLAAERGQAMSEESTTPDLVELVRKQFEALNRRDLDGVMSSVAEDGVLDGRADLIEGRAAIRGFLDDWFGAYEELDYELDEVSHLGGGVVFAVVIQDGRLVGSDGRVRQREGWVYLWVGGSIARLTTSEVDEARAAAERLAAERG
jgi:ketosteroid isomerase-like protein